MPSLKTLIPDGCWMEIYTLLICKILPRKDTKACRYIQITEKLFY
ncbi:hypothetical protein HMPREF1870_01076 [Bacteroidales bacterium KA00344]|nr:hypothetical protein HMPREF1870_01076 [Bacteroidales bacterium KA00344]